MRSRLMSRGPGSLRAAAGLACSIVVPALLTGHASAQTAFSWATAVDGLWSDMMNWTPAGSPGQFSVNDTAELGGVGAYTVTADISRSIANLTLSNSSATLLVESGTALSLNAVSNTGMIVVNDQSSGFTSTVTLRDGAALGGGVMLNAPSAVDVLRAALNGPGGAGQSASLTSDAVLTGTGAIGGNFTSDGLVAADGMDRLIRINSPLFAQSASGMITADNGGEIQGNGTIAGGAVMIGAAGRLGGTVSISGADISFANGSIIAGAPSIEMSSATGTPTIRSTAVLTLRPGVTFDGTVTLSDQSTNGPASLVLADGAEFDANVVLNAASLATISQAIFRGPFVSSQLGTLGSDAVVTGTGLIQGFLLNEGLISAEGPGGIIQVATSGPLMSTGTVRAINGGRLQLNTGLIGGSLIGDAASRIQSSTPPISAVAMSGTLVLPSAGLLSLGAGNTYAGSIVINDQATTGTSTVTVQDGAEIGGMIMLNAPDANTTTRAGLRGPFFADQAATIAANAVVSGTGTLQGNLIHNGLISADGAGTLILISTSTPLDSNGVVQAVNGGRLSITGGLMGGQLIGDAASRIDSTSGVISGVDISGDVVIRSSATLTFGAGNAYNGMIRVNDQATTGVATIRLQDGGTLGGDVELNAPDAVTIARAVINGPFTAGQSGTILAGGQVSGIGFLQGNLVNNGVITANAPGEVIAVSTQSPLVSTGTVEAANGGRLSLTGGLDGGRLVGDAASRIESGNGLIQNATLEGVAVMRSSSLMFLGAGNTYDGTIVINDQSTTGSATLNVADGAALGGTITLNAPDQPALFRALLRGPFTAGQSATISAGTMVSGVGAVQGRLVNNGTIAADAPGEAINVSTSEALVSTGTVEAANGGRLQLSAGLTGGQLVGDAASRIDSSSGIISDVTMSGTLVMPSSTQLTIGTGNTYNGTIVVHDQSNTGASVLTVRDGAALGGNISLNAPTTITAARALLRGPFGAEEAAMIEPDAVISGIGRIDGRFPEVPNTFLPGSEFDPDTLTLAITGGTAFTDTTVLDIGFAGVGDGEFGRVLNQSGPLELDGTLRVRALGGFDPLSTNEIEIISGGTITGIFDTIEYTGNLEPGDVARVFYEGNRVVFAVTCNADTTLPAGVLNVFDILVFLDIWNTQSPGADFDENGQINIFDVLAFLQLWNAGCPE